MIILHFHLQPQFKNELFHILHIITEYIISLLCDLHSQNLHNFTFLRSLQNHYILTQRVSLSGKLRIEKTSDFKTDLCTPSNLYCAVYFVTVYKPGEIPSKKRN